MMKSEYVSFFEGASLDIRGILLSEFGFERLRAVESIEGLQVMDYSDLYLQSIVRTTERGRCPRSLARPQPANSVL